MISLIKIKDEMRYVYLEKKMERNIVILFGNVIVYLKYFNCLNVLFVMIIIIYKRDVNVKFCNKNNLLFM